MRGIFRDSRLRAAWRAISPVVGLPLLYLGTLLLTVNYFCQLHSNAIIAAALLLDMIGVAAHYGKMKRQ